MHRFECSLGNKNMVCIRMYVTKGTSMEELSNLLKFFVLKGLSGTTTKLQRRPQCQKVLREKCFKMEKQDARASCYDTKKSHNLEMSREKHLQLGHKGRTFCSLQSQVCLARLQLQLLNFLMLGFHGGLWFLCTVRSSACETQPRASCT